MSWALKNLIITLDWASKNLPPFSNLSNGVSLCSFTTSLGNLFGIENDIISLVLLVSYGIDKIILKTMARKENRHKKIDFWTRVKLNSVEKIISKTPIDWDISHDEFTVVINENEIDSG